jgi:pimeloyl-ACP methyl ester carboxylesterase
MKAEASNSQNKRVITPARVVALVLIAVVALGLAYLRFKPDDDQVSVPAGAKAGDLILNAGTYATEKGSYPADTGTLVVPENRHDPDSRLIALPVVRIKARTAHAMEPIFRLEGGPGGTNMQFEAAGRLAAHHDVVLVGYRGVDGSSVLDAPEVEAALNQSRDLLSRESFRAYGDGLRAAAHRLRAKGVDLAGYTMSEQADDIEAARTALGYGRINLVSESAGTRLALIYAWRHPESVHRSAMIGLNPPGDFLWDAPTTDVQIQRYSRLYAQSDASRNATTGDLAASMRYTAKHMPDRWLGLPIKEGNVRVASFFGLMESTSKASPFAAPVILDAWRSAANGDASGFWLSSLIAELMFPKMQVWGEYAAIGSADDQAAREYFASGSHKRGSAIGDPGSDFAWGGGLLADAWPANRDDAQYSHMRTSNVETLMIGGTLDVSTPAVNATREMLPFLPNGRQVVLSELGHSGSFWNERPEAGTRLIDTFFDTGKVDDSLYRNVKVDFTPAVSFTMVAKIVAGSMLGLAVVAVVSLLWMARRAHRRVGFGRVKSALLRSLYPIVLGLGGWCLGTLVVMTTSAGVSLDDELMVVLSTAVPAGLGVYYAWVAHSASAATRTTGWVLGTAAALVGAWLGFHTAEAVLALITTTVGAILGANLTLIIFDIMRERSELDLLAAVNPTPAWVDIQAGPAAYVEETT